MSQYSFTAGKYTNTGEWRKDGVKLSNTPGRKSFIRIHGTQSEREREREIDKIVKTAHCVSATTTMMFHFTRKNTQWSGKTGSAGDDGTNDDGKSVCLSLLFAPSLLARAVANRDVGNVAAARRSADSPPP